MASKYNIDALREILKKYKEFDVLQDHGLGLTGEIEDSSLVDELKRIEELQPGTLESISSHVSEVHNRLSEDIKNLDSRILEIGGRLDNLAKSNLNSDYLLSEMQKLIDEKNRKEKEKSLVSRFSFHLELAKNEIYRRKHVR